MTQKDWRPYALHILDTIAKIRRIQIRGDLTQDEVLYDAALRNLQTLSEATQQLPSGMKAGYPNIPWREISEEMSGPNRDNSMSHRHAGWIARRF